MSKARIWELDALRGLCLLGMILVHLVYDLTELYGFFRWNYPPAFEFVMEWGGTAFFLISGISATLGSRSLRRGGIVLGCGLLVSVVTIGMWKLGLSDEGIVIRFGVLHCLGICMVLWHILKKLPIWALEVLGTALAALGIWAKNVRVDTPHLFWLGLVTSDFSSADYFPLLPFLGFFLLGTVLGRLLYAEKCSLLPKADRQNPVIRFLTLCGRHSLWIYLLHQPVLTGLMELLLLF